MNRPADLTRAAGMAYRVLVDRQLHTLPVDPLTILRSCRDTIVWTYSEAADALKMTENEFERQFGMADAFTLSRQAGVVTQYIVAYRACGNPARMRFTLAHELGHRVLRHQDASNASEREADCFASHLLCPRPALRRLAERFSPLYAEQVAAACYVSLSCARSVKLADVEGVDEALLSQTDAQFFDAVMTAEVITAQKQLHEIMKIPE